jgi:hypothetical protein
VGLETIFLAPRQGCLKMVRPPRFERGTFSSGG